MDELTAAAPTTDSFPRQYARTRRFTLGEPRNLVVSPDGKRIVFIRSRAGDDPVNCLYVLDVESDEERLIGDPLTLLIQDDPDDIPAEEQARRERMRETASGITTFATDAAVTVVAFPLAGRLFVGGLLSGAARELVVDGPVFDPRPDPTARRVAYVCGNSLRIAELDGSSWELASDEDPEVSWGSADFIAAEEIHRNRGYWWSPDGSAVAACRVDVSQVDHWYIADPAAPDQPAHEVRYPAAGTPNAVVELHDHGFAVVGILREHQDPQLFLERGQLGFGLGQLLAQHLPVGVRRVDEQFAGSLRVGGPFPVGTQAFDHGGQILVALRHPT